MPSKAPPDGTQIVQKSDFAQLALHDLCLRAVDGPAAGATFSVSASNVSIGSGTDNDIVLDDPAVSRRHCEIVARGDRYIVRDLGSTNGTWISGVEVREAFITADTQLSIGETSLVFSPEATWERIVPAPFFGEMVGRTPLMKGLFGLLARIARTDLTCLIRGETGTGKELAARGIHEESRRAKGPFEVIDCAGVTPSLVESVLFGHEKGAFTGAESTRLGSFERAHGGTVFLDEIGELPLDLQPRLLRVLERREITRVGGNAPIPVDVRIVAATHRDLRAMVEDGTFREDLFFRLAEVVVQMPALDRRKEDIPVLVQAVAGDVAVAPDVMQALCDRSWPGNVRELRNLVRRATALARSGKLDLDALDVASSLGPTQSASPTAPPSAQGMAVPVPLDESLKKSRENWLRLLEPAYLRGLLLRYEGNIDAVSAHAGLHRKSLLRLLRQHGITIPKD